MQLQKISVEVLRQIIHLCKQLSDEDYSKNLNLLMNNSIGKHVRHIINFFDLTIQSNKDSTLDYSLRKRDLFLETNTEKTIQKIEAIITKIMNIDTSKKITLKTCYDLENNDSFSTKSCIERELVYNIEHAIHHMAIIKIALLKYFPHIETVENFGIAYSTVKYLKECAQ